MHHAARVIQRLAVDGQAGMPGRAEQLEEIAEVGLVRDGDDVGPRDHHVIDAHLVQPEDVLEHRPFEGREACLALV